MSSEYIYKATNLSSAPPVNIFPTFRKCKDQRVLFNLNSRVFHRVIDNNNL